MYVGDKVDMKDLPEVEQLKARVAKLQVYCCLLVVIGGGVVGVTLVWLLIVTAQLTIAHDCANEGHNYTARYDETPANKEMIEAISAIPQLDGYPHATCQAIREATKRTYLCDVCTYCGSVTRRSAASD